MIRITQTRENQTAKQIRVATTALLFVTFSVAFGISAMSQSATAQTNKRKPTTTKRKVVSKSNSPTTRPTTRPSKTGGNPPGAALPASLPNWTEAKVTELDIVSIWEYQLETSTYYQLVPSCCDRFTTTFDEAGNYVCAPSGGFAGSGANDCAEPHKQPKNLKLVWQLR